MPLRDGGKNSHSSRKIQRLKQCAALVFVAAGLLTVVDFSGLQLTSEAAQKRSLTRVQQSSASASDCTFLKDPEGFREAQARHRLTVSRTTETFRESSRTESLRSGETTRTKPLALVPPQDIPRKNFIDTILFNRMGKDGLSSAPLCTDTEFIRRVTLDMTGRIPAPNDVTQFLADANPNKRDALVDALAQSAEYIDKWTMFLGDLYKNSAFATNINAYRGGRDAFYFYLKDAVGSNRGYDRIATDLIAGNGDSFNAAEGFTNFQVLGNVPMGPAQDTMDGLAVTTSNAFLGINAMDCLLCHDGAGHLDQVNLWGSQRKRVEAWGMAAFFARSAKRGVQLGTPPTTNYVKYVVSENTTGEYNLNTNYGNRQNRNPINGKTTVAPLYAFNGGGTVNTGENRRQAMARLITTDPQFSRATVNYIWEKLMVEGLVSPVNAFDPARISPNAQMPEGWTLQPANAELLETLAQDFRQNGFDLRYLISTIAKSSAYQLSSQYAGTWKLDYVPYFARKYVRRLDAEEVHDAIIKATGIMPTMAFNGVTKEGYVITDDINTEIRRVTWAMQLPEPVEPRSNGAARAFLDSFLRGDRDQKLRTLDPSILQSLNLMNNSFVMGRVHKGNAGSAVSKLLANTSLTNEQIIEQLYLATLSRKPTATEVSKLLPYYTSLGKQVATESVQWVLLNKVDFMFNY